MSDTSAHQVTMLEKSLPRHIEDSKEYASNETNSPAQSTAPPEWEEEKPRLNSQMVLAFIVCCCIYPPSYIPTNTPDRH